MSDHARVTGFAGDPSMMYRTDISERDAEAASEGTRALEKGLPPQLVDHHRSSKSGADE